MFRGEIQAWKDGPVAVDAWRAFGSFEHRPITPLDVLDAASLPLRDRMFVGAIWEAYKDPSTTALWRQTHEERPWLEARGDLAPAARSQAEIRQESMSAFFTAEALRREPSFTGVLAAREEIRRGEVDTLESLRSELGAA